MMNQSIFLKRSKEWSYLFQEKGQIQFNPQWKQPLILGTTLYVEPKRVHHLRGCKRMNPKMALYSKYFRPFSVLFFFWVTSQTYLGPTLGCFCNEVPLICREFNFFIKILVYVIQKEHNPWSFSAHHLFLSSTNVHEMIKAHLGSKIANLQWNPEKNSRVWKWVPSNAPRLGKSFLQPRKTAI